MRGFFTIMDTKQWLHESLELVNDPKGFTRNGKEWLPVAGFSSCGSILSIYKGGLNHIVSTLGMNGLKAKNHCWDIMTLICHGMI
jgi:hypothetical protein